MGKEQYVREMCEYFLPRKSKSKKGFERRPKKKGKRVYRVSGRWNRQPESTWSQFMLQLHSSGCMGLVT